MKKSFLFVVSLCSSITLLGSSHHFSSKQKQEIQLLVSHMSSIGYLSGSKNSGLKHLEMLKEQRKMLQKIISEIGERITPDDPWGLTHRGHLSDRRMEKDIARASISSKFVSGKLMEGEVLKRSDWLKKWNPRYLVLKDDEILYYNKQDDLDPQAQFPLNECAIKEISYFDINKDYCFEISYKGSKKRMLFQVTDKTDYDRWIDFLTQKCHSIQSNKALQFPPAEELQANQVIKIKKKESRKKLKARKQKSNDMVLLGILLSGLEEVDQLKKQVEEEVTIQKRLVLSMIAQLNKSP